MGSKFSRVAMASVFLSLIAFAAQEVDARGGRGGGGGGRGFSGGSRGGGSMSIGRGGSFGGGGGFNRSGGYTAHVSSGGSGFSRSGSYSRPSGSYSKPKSGYGPSAWIDSGANQRPDIGTGQRPGGGASQLPAGGVGPRPGIGTGQRPGGGVGQLPAADRPGQLPGRGDINVDIDNGGNWGDWDGWGDYPLGAGIVIGAVAGWTAAEIGSAYYALPPGCSPYPDTYFGYSFYNCGAAWYQPQYEGDTIVYVNVPDPSTRPAPPEPKDTSGN